MPFYAEICRITVQNPCNSTKCLTVQMAKINLYLDTRAKKQVRKILCKNCNSTQ